MIVGKAQGQTRTERSVLWATTLLIHSKNNSNLYNSTYFASTSPLHSLSKVLLVVSLPSPTPVSKEHLASWATTQHNVLLPINLENILAIDYTSAATAFRRILHPLSRRLSANSSLSGSSYFLLFILIVVCSFTKSHFGDISPSHDRGSF